MKPVPFLAFRKSPAPPCLPEPLKRQVEEGIRNPRIGHRPPTVSETLLQAIDDSGLNLDQLCDRMAKPGSKTRITLHFLTKTLSEDMPEMWVQMRILKALEIRWEDYQRIIEANEAAMRSCWDRERQASAVYREYRNFGPRLLALFRDDVDVHNHGAEDLLRMTRLVDMRGSKDFNPPSVIEMGRTIACHPDTCSHPATRSRYPISGFRYYQLPDEIHDFDPQGNLLATGDMLLHPPPGLKVAPTARACCGGAIRSKVKMPPIPLRKKPRSR